MTNIQSSSNAPIEWLVVHHELKNGLRCLTIQHSIEPMFMAEVTENKENKGCHVEFVPGVSVQVLTFQKKVQSRWKEKASAEFKSRVERQFNQAGGQV